MDNYIEDHNLINLGYQFENEFLDHLTYPQSFI